MRQIADEFVATVVTFFRKPQMWVAICFMLFYRMPEGLLAKVSALFLVDSVRNGGLGLSDVEYGLVQGTVGIIGLTLGGILGGVVASRDGLKRWLWPMVMAITLPDLVYVYLSYALPSNLLIIDICVFVEQFGYGFGFSAICYTLFIIAVVTIKPPIMRCVLLHGSVDDDTGHVCWSPARGCGLSCVLPHRDRDLFADLYRDVVFEC